MRNLVRELRDRSIEEVSKLEFVQRKLKQYWEEEARMLKIIRDSSCFLEEDEKKEVVIIDLTSYQRRPHLIKNLALLLYPEALGVMEVYNLTEQGVKSNHLGFSMALSIQGNRKNHKKNISEIMRTLNIGDGHPGAAAGTVRCSSKQEMLKQKKGMLNLYRSVRSLLAVLLALGSAVALAVGAGQLLGCSFTVVSALVAPLVLGISLGNLVYMMGRFYEEFGIDQEPRRAAHKAVVTVGVAIFLACITTVFGFASFGFSDFDVLREFGYMTAAGIGLCFIFSVTFLPSLMILREERRMRKGTTRMPRGVAIFSQESHSRVDRFLGRIAGIAQQGVAMLSRVCRCLRWKRPVCCVTRGALPRQSELGCGGREEEAHAQRRADSRGDTAAD